MGLTNAGYQHLARGVQSNTEPKDEVTGESGIGPVAGRF